MERLKKQVIFLCIFLMIISMYSREYNNKVVTAEEIDKVIETKIDDRKAFYGPNYKVDVQDLDLNEFKLFYDYVLYKTKDGDAYYYDIQEKKTFFIDNEVKKIVNKKIYLKNNGDLYSHGQVVSNNVTQFKYANEEFAKDRLYYINENGDLYCVKEGKGKKSKLVTTNVKDVWLRVSYFPEDYREYGYKAIFIKKKDDSLWSMGDNKVPNLGCGDKRKRNKPVKILENVEDVYFSSQTLSVFALKNDNTFWSWGRSVYNGFNTGGTVLKPKKLFSNVKEFILDRLAVIKENGDLYSWDSGLGYEKKKGDGWRKKKIGTNVKRIGNRFFIKEDNSLWTWGRWAGHGYVKKCKKPTKLLENIVDVHIESQRSIALSSSGDLFFWGDASSCNIYDCNSVGIKTSIKSPLKVEENVVAISSEFFLKNNGDAFFWQIDTELKPVLVSNDAQDIREISGNTILKEGKGVYIKYWDDKVFTDLIKWNNGDLPYGEKAFYGPNHKVNIDDIDLSTFSCEDGWEDYIVYKTNNNDAYYYDVKKMLTTFVDSDVKKIVSRTIYLKNNGELYSNSRLISNEVVRFEVGDIYSNERKIYFVKQNGDLYCADEKKEESSIFLATNVKDIWIRDIKKKKKSSTIFIKKDDDSLWSMGDNPFHILGCGDKKKRNTPEKILSEVENIYFSLNSKNVYAIKKDKSVWAWGDFMYSGFGTKKDILKPRKLFSNVKIFSVENKAILQENGTLYSWDKNIGNKKKGHGWTSKKLGSNVKKFGERFFIKKDDSLWTWGKWAGHGYIKKCKKPTKLLKNVEDAYLEKGASIALKKNGDLYFWGDSEYNFRRKKFLSAQKVHNVRFGKKLKVPKKVEKNIKEITGEFYIKNNGELYSWNRYYNIGKTPTLLEKNIQEIMYVYKIGPSNSREIIFDRDEYLICPAYTSKYILYKGKNEIYIRKAWPRKSYDDGFYKILEWNNGDWPI